MSQTNAAHTSVGTATNSPGAARKWRPTATARHNCATASTANTDEITRDSL
ncbi:hypothetical protein RKD45_005920 [Streptomyces griseus]